MSYFLIEPTKFLNCSSKLSLKPFLFLGQHQLLQFSLSATADKKARPTFLMVIMRESSLYHELFLKREQTPAPSSLMHHCGLNFWITYRKWDNHDVFGVKIQSFKIHTVRNLHFLSKNSTLISREKLSNCFGWKLAKMLRFWTF